LLKKGETFNCFLSEFKKQFSIFSLSIGVFKNMLGTSIPSWSMPPKPLQSGVAEAVWLLKLL
jgi:hypothetical protein